MGKKNSSLKVLLIEDCDTDAFTIQKALCEYKEDSQCMHVATLKAGEEILQKGGVDVLLLDLGLPDTASARDTYEQTKKWCERLPVIIMTNLKDHALAKIMVHEGVADFLNKDIIIKDPKHIQDSIDFALERHDASRKLLFEKEKAEQESKQKDAVLSCFMGGYSSGPEK